MQCTEMKHSSLAGPGVEERPNSMLWNIIGSKGPGLLWALAGWANEAQSSPGWLEYRQHRAHRTRVDCIL